LILEILNVFLWLKFSPSLTLNKIEGFSKVSFCPGKEAFDVFGVPDKDEQCHDQGQAR